MTKHIHTHTPEPWFVDPRNPCHVVDDKGSLIASTQFNPASRPHSLEQMKPNAVLIAAAPRLKNELIELCFKADTAIRYLRHAVEGMKDKQTAGSIEGLILAMERQIGSARQTIDEAIGYTGEVKE
jgi:hypothetical protein